MQFLRPTPDRYLALQPRRHYGGRRLAHPSNPGVFARLRSFAFNILKSNPIGTLAQDRYRAALIRIDKLLMYLAIPQR